MFFKRQIKLTGTEYIFNDFPLNTMNWSRNNRIRANFNVGNPQRGDSIKAGDVSYVIVGVEWQRPIYFLSVKKI